MSIDLADTIAPKSDQMNAEDLLTGPRVFTVKEVRIVGSGEQPVSIILEEFPESRPFKPSKTVRRILVAAWGRDGANYPGHRMKLYCDPKVSFAGQAVGGIRVSHLSHIDKRMTLVLATTKGKRSSYTVEPLPDDVSTAAPAPADLLDQIKDALTQRGIPEDAWLPGVNRITGGSATALETITEDEARQVLASLTQRPDAEPDQETHA